MLNKQFGNVWPQFVWYVFCVWKSFQLGVFLHDQWKTGILVSFLWLLTRGSRRLRWCFFFSGFDCHPNWGRLPQLDVETTHYTEKKCTWIQELKLIYIYIYHIIPVMVEATSPRQLPVLHHSSFSTSYHCFFLSPSVPTHAGAPSHGASNVEVPSGTIVKEHGTKKTSGPVEHLCYKLIYTYVLHPPPLLCVFVLIYIPVKCY